MIEGYRPISPFAFQHLSDSLSPWRAPQIHRWYCVSFLLWLREQVTSVRMPVRYKWAARQSCPVNKRKTATAFFPLGLLGISKRQRFLPCLVFIINRSSSWYKRLNIVIINSIQVRKEVSRFVRCTLLARKSACSLS